MDSGPKEFVMAHPIHVATDQMNSTMVKYQYLMAPALFGPPFTHEKHDLSSTFTCPTPRVRSCIDTRVTARTSHQTYLGLSMSHWLTKQSQSSLFGKKTRHLYCALSSKVYNVYMLWFYVLWCDKIGRGSGHGTKTTDVYSIHKKSFEYTYIIGPARDPKQCSSRVARRHDNMGNGRKEFCFPVLKGSL